MDPRDDDSSTQLIRLLAEVREREREQMMRADRLQAALDARDEYLSAVSHELRTPLGILILQLDVHERAVKRAGNALLEQEMQYGVLRRQLLRLETLVHQLHDVAKLGRGRLELEPNSVDLRAIVERVLDRFSPETTQHATSIPRDELESVVGRWDPERLAQVVTNLVTNAVRHGGGKLVRVRTGASDGGARLVVQDAGSGIAPEDHERVFEFGRAVSAKHRGRLGLGLWISRQIVHAHGGVITLTSAIGEGATFEVWLPLAAPDRASIEGSLGEA